MQKITNNRAMWSVGAFLAGLVLAGASPLADSRARRDADQSVPFYYDLEELNNSRGLRGGDPHHPIQLVVMPTRVSKAGLMLRVEVWNLADDAQRVYPIDPSTYLPEFRDAAGRSLRGNLLPPGYPINRTIDDFARIERGNCLATNYLFPTFYKRMRGAKGIECRVGIDVGYGRSSKLERFSQFELSSEWVKVPSP